MITFESREDCGEFFNFACSQGGDEADIDWEQCIADTEAAQCTNGALASPASCDEE